MCRLWVAGQYRPPALGWWCISWDSVLTTSCLCSRLTNSTSVNYRVWLTWVPTTSNRYYQNKYMTVLSNCTVNLKHYCQNIRTLSNRYCQNDNVQIGGKILNILKICTSERLHIIFPCSFLEWRRKYPLISDRNLPRLVWQRLSATRRNSFNTLPVSFLF